MTATGGRVRVQVPPSAVRVDERLGVREEVAFVGAPERLFACLHSPAAGEAAAGVVVCSPVLTDFGANYRREVDLARRLAATGVAVLRTHPRGTGHSDGDRLALGVDSVRADARTALAHLRERLPDRPVGFLGTRLGAFAAAALAVDAPGAPLALWQPVTDPRAYVREGLRARAVHLTRHGGTAPDPDTELAERGYVDLLGVPVGPSLFASDRRESLAEAVGPAPRPVLLVQLDGRDALAPPYERLVEQWTATGSTVRTACVRTDESWWFVPERGPATSEVVTTTADWLRAGLVAR